MGSESRGLNQIEPRVNIALQPKAVYVYERVNVNEYVNVDVDLLVLVVVYMVGCYCFAFGVGLGFGFGAAFPPRGPNMPGFPSAFPSSPI